MFPRVKAVHHIWAYQLHCTFMNQRKATIDLESRIVGRGGVFEPLEDVAYFKRCSVDPVSGALTWPNGVSFDPDVIYSLATDAPLPHLG